MTDVVLLVALVILGIAAAIFLLMILALFIRTGIDAVGVDGTVSVEARYGIVRIPIWPPPQKKGKTPKTEKTAQKQATKKKRQKYKYSLNKEELDIGQLICLALTLLSELSDTLRISRLHVRVVIGTEDAAQTGLLLGASAAITGMTVPFLENTFEMKDYHIDIDADFEAAKTNWASTVFCSLRPISLVFLLLRHRRELFCLYKRLIKKEEAIANE